MQDYSQLEKFGVHYCHPTPGLGSQLESVYNIQFNGKAVEATAPYVVNDADEVVNFILRLEPRPKALYGTGYFHQVAKEAETQHDNVCMAVLLIQKGVQKGGPVTLDLGELPIEFSILSRYLANPWAIVKQE